MMPPAAAVAIAFGLVCGWLGWTVATLKGAANAIAVVHDAEACARNTEQLESLRALIRADTDAGAVAP